MYPMAPSQSKTLISVIFAGSGSLTNQATPIYPATGLLEAIGSRCKQDVYDAALDAVRKLDVFIQPKQHRAGCKQDRKDSRRNVGSGSLLGIFFLSCTASLLYKYLDRIAQFYFLISSQATSSYALLTRCIIIEIPITNPDPLSITVPFDEKVLPQPQLKIHVSCSDFAYHGCSASSPILTRSKKT